VVSVQVAVPVCEQAISPSRQGLVGAQAAPGTHVFVVVSGGVSNVTTSPTTASCRIGCSVDTSKLVPPSGPR
jgi:hypothetical protein